MTNLNQGKKVEDDDESYTIKDAIKEAFRYYEKETHIIPDNDEITNCAAGFLSDETGGDFEDCYNAVENYILNSY